MMEENKNNKKNIQVILQIDPGTLLKKTTEIDDDKIDIFTETIFNNLKLCEEYFLFATDNGGRVLVNKNRIIALEVIEI